MAQKIVWLPEIGEVVLAKRKGSKTIRLSISSVGKVRVGMPPWVPYSAGVSFVKSRTDWINKHRQLQPKVQINNGSRIGKSYRLSYSFEPSVSKTRSRISGQTVKITSNLPLENESVQRIVSQASERALKAEAISLLPIRLAELANRHDYSFKSVRIKKLSSRWGSCSSDKIITLNYFLMQLPWDLIEYVLLHELVHTRHLNHSADFWRDFETVYPGAKRTRNRLRDYKPVINTID